MKLREIIENVLNGSIELDFHGHYVHGKKYYLERLKDRFDRDVANSLGANDGKWSKWDGKTTKEVDAQMRQHFLSKFNYEIEIGHDLTGCDMPDSQCYKCAKRLQWKFLGDKLILNTEFDNTLRNWISHPNTCEYEHLESVKDTIDIHGTLIITNYFRSLRNDCDPDSEYTDLFNINYDIGRKNVTHYKAQKQNVAYGQMGNMSIGVYLAKDKKSIVIADAYLDEREELTQEAKDLLANYKYRGSISLGVWRWEATDIKTLGKEGLATLKEQEDKNYMDVIRMKVPHGKWEFEHFYGWTASDNHDDPLVYSKFTLIEQ